MNDTCRQIKRTFTDNFDNLCRSYKDNRNAILVEPPYFALYKVDIVLKHGSSQKESYTVSQALGFKSRPSDELSKCITERNIGMMPVAGVACRVRDKNTHVAKETGPLYNVFCFLPLPIDSGLPVYVHGYFALDHENRRSLWQEKEDKSCFKTIWNKNMMQNVLCQAYVKLFDAVRDEETKGITDFQEHSKVNAVAKYVMDLLPRVKNAKGEYWRLLTNSVFQELATDNHQFLPCYLNKIVENSYLFSSMKYIHSRLCWLCLKSEEDDFPAYNSDESSSPKDFSKSQQNAVLRDIGMKIVCIDKTVQETMLEAGVPINDVTPEIVVDFLCSYDMHFRDGCTISTGVEIASTSLKSVENLNLLIKFIVKKPKYVLGKLTRIPIMLCEDGILRCLKNGTIFITSFPNLFNANSNLFLHHAVYKEHKEKFREMMQQDTSLLKKFTVSDFSGLAKKSNFVTVESTRYVRWDEEKVTGNWLKEFWAFFEECVSKQTNAHQVTTHNKCVLIILSELSHLALVPITQSDCKMLCAPRLLYSLIDIESFSSAVSIVFRKLEIPTIFRGEVVFRYLTIRAKNCLIPNMARSSCANSVAQCLNFHQSKLETTDLSVNDAKTILRYFNENLPISNDSKEILKSLRLFSTYTGDVVAMKDFEKTSLIPNAMPKCGINEIIKASRVLLIEIDYTHDELMKALDVKDRNILDVYIDHILPMQNQMARVDFYEHVQFLGKYIEDHKTHEKERILTILQMLRTTAFVETANGRKLVQDMFDNKHKIFAQLCKDAGFLPIELRSDSLRNLMQQLDLKKELKLEHFVRFANEISLASKFDGVTSKLRENSILLLKHLCSMNDDFFTSNCIDELLDIPFVEPYIVESKYTRLAGSASRGKFEPIRGMVSKHKWMICWSSSLIFPYSSENISSFLQIQECPLPEQWRAHCKNIGRNIQKVLQNPSTFDLEDIKFVMEWIYKSAGSYEQSVDFKTVFLDTPLIFLPDKMLIVPARNIILQCQGCEEIPPYVMQAPTYYGKYFDTFLKLGAYQSNDVLCYSAVLSQLPHGESLLPKELSDAKNAMTNIIDLLRSVPPKSVKLQELFLLCSDEVIRKSICTIVADSVLFRHRLEKSHISIPFVWTGKKNLEFDLKTCFGNIPDIIRPHFLSEVVTEDIDTSRRTFDSSEIVSKIQEYMHSSLFKEFFLRLARHAYITKHNVELKDEMKNKIIKIINNLDIKCVKGIHTVLRMSSVESGQKQNRQTVSGTEKSKMVHVQYTDDKTEIFVQVSGGPLWVDTLKEQWLKFTRRITEGSFDKEYRVFIMCILNYSARREDIEEIFEENGILPYDVKFEADPVTPIPGTFVPKHLHKYLDNSYGVIHNFEYRFIAYLVEDPALGDDDIEDCSPTYIFVKVVRRIEETVQEHELVQEYEIDSGEEETFIVKAYLLYKFVRNEKGKLSNEKSVVIYNRESKDASFVPEQSMKDICVEIRQILIDAWRRNDIERRHIIQRLMLKWHPDKNLGNIQLATKVFQYIQYCLRILESGKQIPEYKGDDEDFVDGSRSSSFTGGSAFWHDRYWGRHRQSYSDDDWFPRGRRGGGGVGGGGGRRYDDDPFADFFSETEREPYHFYSEASRWQKQADSDLLEAERSLRDSEAANNWICYKAHQAAEKSLKAAWYAKDANKIGNIKNSHDLACIASGLDNTLLSLAGQIVFISGYHTRMRYPDTMHGTIPAHAYSRRNADMLTSRARFIIAHVRSNYLR